MNIFKSCFLIFALSSFLFTSCEVEHDDYIDGFLDAEISTVVNSNRGTFATNYPLSINAIESEISFRDLIDYRFNDGWIEIDNLWPGEIIYSLNIDAGGVKYTAIDIVANADGVAILDDKPTRNFLRELTSSLQGGPIVLQVYGETNLGKGDKFTIYLFNDLNLHVIY